MIGIILSAMFLIAVIWIGKVLSDQDNVTPIVVEDNNLSRDWEREYLENLLLIQKGELNTLRVTQTPNSERPTNSPKF